MNEHSPFDRLMRGPEVLHQVRTNLADLSKGASVERMVQQTLAEHDYAPSARQWQVMRRSLPLVQEHRDTLHRTRTLFKERPERIKEETAHVFNARAYEVLDLEFHATSATATVPLTVIIDQGNSINRDFGAEVFNAAACAGLTDEEYYLKVRKTRLPLSLKNKIYENEANGHVAEHEDLHVQYRYLHPGASGETEENESQEPYLVWQQNYTKELVANNSKDEFSQLVKDITSAELALYLNELSSEALTNHHNVYKQTFSGGGHLYANKFGLKLRTLTNAVLQHSETNLSWIRVIREEVQRTKHKAAYINKAYQQLVEQETPHLVEIAEMLTPKQGYIINALVDGKPTLTKMKQWKKEYEQAPDEELSSEDLLFEAIGIDPTVIMKEGYDTTSYDSAITHTVHAFWQKQHSFLEESENPDFASNFYLFLSPLLSAQKNRIEPLQMYLNRIRANPENSFGLTEEQVTHIMTKTIDFDTIFFSTWEHGLHGISRELLSKSKFQHGMRRVFSISLTMDSAAEDVTAALLGKGDVDVTQFINPLYQRPQEKKQQIFDLLHKGATDTTGLSPQEREALMLYHVIIDNEIAEIPGNIVDLEKSDVAYFQSMRRLLSMCMRSIIYARESDIPLEQFNKPAAILNSFTHYGILPDPYLLVTRIQSEEQAEENVKA
jgi:hypothetical protein